MPDEPVLMPVSQCLPDWLDDYELRVDSYLNGTARGAVTGLQYLDNEILTGCLMPGLHYLTGGSGSGKSALLLQIAVHCGVPVVYLQCEMSRNELINRLICNINGASLSKLKSGQYKPEEIKAFTGVLQTRCQHMSILDGTKSYVGINQLSEACKTARGEHRNCMLIIDSFHSWSQSVSLKMDAPFSSQNEYTNLRDHVTACKRLSGELNAPILLATERNRSSAGGLSTAKGYGVEYSAETMINLVTDEYNPDTLSKTVAIYVEKNRHGRTLEQGEGKPADSKYKLRYDLLKQQFTESKK
jgi:replicative DNA helicase